MRIRNLTLTFIKKHRTKSMRRLSKRLSLNPKLAYYQGWDNAIRFAILIECSLAICEQCGKIIGDTDDLERDVEGVPFCKKCYDKLFTKEN